jgi:hypothetical protein
MQQFFNGVRHLRVRESIGMLWQRFLFGFSQQRGDVPGWVLVTVMSAGLVTMLWFLADGLLADVFSRAVDSVTGP